MKYCLRCGLICSEDSFCYKDISCDTCGYKLTEDNMTTLKYNLLSETEKDTYEQNLLQIIQSSPVFDERLYSIYHKYGTSNFYFCFRFDKFEQMTGKKAGRKMTQEESDDLKQHMQAIYGKGSKLYEEAVVQQCIETDRARKQESSNTPHCPTCQSTNLHKISTTSKVVNTVAFGLLGTKRHKTFHCNNCGYEW